MDGVATSMVILLIVWFLLIFYNTFWLLYLDEKELENEKLLEEGRNLALKKET